MNARERCEVGCEVKGLLTHEDHLELEVEDVCPPVEAEHVEQTDGEPHVHRVGRVEGRALSHAALLRHATLEQRLERPVGRAPLRMVALPELRAGQPVHRRNGGSGGTTGSSFQVRQSI